jgi:predicted tellurium resistance membrane protein TerC
MIMHILPSTFLMNLLGWVFSVSGLFLGFIAVSMMFKVGRD